MATAIPFKDYGISLETGFLPDLPDSLPEYYRAWHELAANTTTLIMSQKMREETLKLPLLETSKLNTPKDLQLAHLQLCIITGGYCWERGPMEVPQSVPACVAIPLCDIADKLGMQPGMAYYCLTGNWKWIDKTKPPTRDNVQIRYQLPGGQQFIDFTKITVELESSFARTFPALEDLLQGSELNDAPRVVKGLQFLTEWVKGLELSSKDFHQIMQPDTFFNEIISLFRGFNESSGLPEGMTYEGVIDRPKRTVINSAASQTVIFQIIDRLLRVDYPLDKQMYFTQLRVSWPETYRQFFQFLQNSPGNVREMAKSGDNQELTQVYNELLTTLQHFRSYHVQLVTKFMLLPNKRLRQTLNITDPDPFADMMSLLKDIRNASADSKLD